ncbi:hypothetical protein HZA87_06270 [Candidatus Uhrbacteria bacterium]|nr:hypothetical protein [Candidatus Uhrbacteria bacterium]
MEVPPVNKILTGLTMLTLVLGAFVVSGQTHCPTQPSTSRFVGSVCTAEVLGAQTLWVLEEDHPSVMNQKLILIAVIVFGFLLQRRPLPPKVNLTLRAWFRTQNLSHKLGPVPLGVFVPYLFATHGL